VAPSCCYRPTAAGSWWQQDPPLLGLIGYLDQPLLGLTADPDPINLGLDRRTQQLVIHLGPTLLGSRAHQFWVMLDRMTQHH